MQLRRSDLADLTYFLAIARHRSFRAAALELGVSTSALSHALKGLETRLDIRLLHRTNRSVTLTAAGAELRNLISEPFETIDSAVEVLNRYRDVPSGRIRLNVPEDAAVKLLAPVLPLFADAYPDISLDVSVNNRMVDVIDEGFDAGIRFGGTVPEDMVAQRLSADIRWFVVAAPAYLARFGTPRHPDDLAQHRCLQIRLGDDRIYKWEFDRGEEHLVRAVPGTITLNETKLSLALALNGTGLMYAPEPVVRAHLDDGTLMPVLEEWVSMGQGYYIYYSSRRQLPAGLRLLIDLIREIRPLGL